MRKTISLLAAWVAVATAAKADDWPQWRGPSRDGSSAETHLLDKWPAEGPPRLWTAEVGAGVSSPVVAGGKVYCSFLKGPSGEAVACFDAAGGRLIWSYDKGDATSKHVKYGAKSTPAVGGGKVFFQDAAGSLHCLDAADGKALWKVDARRERIPVGGYGQAASPLVTGSLVIAGGLPAALDVQTGKVLWRSEGKEGSHSSPLLLTGGGRTVLLSTGKGLTARDPRTGKVLWTQEGFGSHLTALPGSGMILTYESARGGRLAAFACKAEAETFSAAVGWRHATISKGQHAIVSAVHHAGHFYVPAGRGLACIAADSGKTVWDFPYQVPWGSPILADGKIILPAEKGEVLMLAADPTKARLLGRARLCEDGSASPALSGGRLYVRDCSKLYCYQVSGANPAGQTGSTVP